MNISLSGKRALVCGGSHGIGFAAAKLLAQTGASVTLVARNEKSLMEACQQLHANELQNHDFLVADLSDPYSSQNEVERYIKDGNAIDILINNSGGPAPAPLLGEKYVQLLSSFNQHVITAQLLTQLVVPRMIEKKWGRIINIISTSVKAPIPGFGVSNTIRGAMASWSKTMAGELAPFGISVNNVLPGSINTQRIASIEENEAKHSGRTRQQVRADREASIPMGRVGQPHEIAAAIVFLASQEASYITGINLPVDGGSTPCL